MQFVPPDKQTEKVPCRHIPLTSDGQTVFDLYQGGATQPELEEALDRLVDQDDCAIRGPGTGQQERESDGSNGRSFRVAGLSNIFRACHMGDGHVPESASEMLQSKLRNIV